MSTDDKHQLEVIQDDPEENAGVQKDYNYVEATPKEWRRLLWKLDRRIIPYVGLLYLCSFLDRSNIGNAKLAGIIEDLNMSQSDYNVALSIFFVGYIIFEVPSNMMLKIVGPSIWIPLVMIAWGVVMMAMAAVTNGPGLLASRFFLGIAEAGLFPGVIFYLSMWYTRRTQASRISIFFGCSTLAGAFGGVLAYGIMQMDGIRNLHGWQWIFIIEAIPTILLAVGTYFILPDFPENSKFLNEREREVLIHTLKKDAGPATETHFSWYQLRAAFLDWKVWTHSLIYICGSIPLYSLSLFLPSIISGMGFSNLAAQAMSAPPYAIACFFTIAVAIDADRRGERGFHVAGPAFLGMIGYILLVTLRDKGNVALYIASCITVTGVFGHAPAMLSWFSNNIGGHTKRGVASAIIISIGNVGGAIGGQIYRASDAPHYVNGHTACACLLAANVIVSLSFKYALKRINKKRENLTREEYLKACEGKELCDLHPDFRYYT